MNPDLFTDVGYRLDLLVPLWVGVITLVVALGVYLVGEWMGADFLHTGFAVMLGVCAFIALLGTAIIAFPYQSQYHKVYSLDTEIVSVSNVFTEASGDLTRTPVAQLAGVDRPVVIADPRVVDLVGEDVTLLCTVTWNYQAADTYSCTIRSIGGNR